MGLNDATKKVLGYLSSVALAVAVPSSIIVSGGILAGKVGKYLGNKIGKKRGIKQVKKASKSHSFENQEVAGLTDVYLNRDVYNQYFDPNTDEILSYVHEGESYVPKKFIALENDLTDIILNLNNEEINTINNGLNFGDDNYNYISSKENIKHEIEDSNIKNKQKILDNLDTILAQFETVDILTKKDVPISATEIESHYYFVNNIEDCYSAYADKSINIVPICDNLRIEGKLLEGRTIPKHSGVTDEVIVSTNGTNLQIKPASEAHGYKYAYIIGPREGLKPTPTPGTPAPTGRRPAAVSA